MAGIDQEGATLNQLMDELIRHLDLALFMDKLVARGLMDHDMLMVLDNLINAGNRSSAVRKVLVAIRTNPPGYLETFVDILKDHPKTEHYGNRITTVYREKKSFSDSQPSTLTSQPPTLTSKPPTLPSSASVDHVIPAGVSDEYFIDRYVHAIEQHRGRLFDRQRLLAYKELLIAAGAMTDRDYEYVRRKHERNRNQMEAIVAILLEKRDLKRFIGLSAVWYKYAETAAEEIFPFVYELGDQHPIKGNLKIQHDTTAQEPHPPQQPPPEHVPIVAQQPLPSSDHRYKLLWMVAGSEDVGAVRRVISDLVHSQLSEAHSTDMVTYWEATLFGEVHLLLSYPNQNEMSRTCQHMLDMCHPDMALLTGVCITCEEIGKVKLGDLIISKAAINIHSGMYEHNSGHHYDTQVEHVTPSVIADLEVERKTWDKEWLKRYVDKIPSTTLTNQRLWYTRLYLELTKEEGDHEGWLKVVGWNTTEGYAGPTNKHLTEKHVPNLRSDFRNKSYWEMKKTNTLPYKPVHKEMIERCEESMVLCETDFPPPPSSSGDVYCGTMLTTDRQPTGAAIIDGRRHRNTVLAADMDTYHFYSCVNKCKVFLSVKGVFLLDDKLSDLDHTSAEYSDYARLSSACFGLQAIRYLYHKHCK